MKTPYKLLCEAREALGLAHDRISEACQNFGGDHHQHLVGVCPTINDLIEQTDDACRSARENLIEQLHDACGAACEQKEDTRA